VDIRFADIDFPKEPSVFVARAMSGEFSLASLQRERCLRICVVEQPATSSRARQKYEAVRRLLPPSQMLKMRYYFDDYGCLKCGNLNATLLQ
jgi:hypothetical protein